MRLEAKVSFKQYVRLLYSLTYQKPIMRCLIGVAIILASWIIMYHLDLFNLPEPIIYQYLTLLLIVIVQPIVIFSTIRRNYYSSTHLRESLEMELTNNEIKIRGESFYMEILWSKIFKIIERQNWFLIYQNNLSAIIIPKRHLTENEVNEIRAILKNTKDVPKELSTS